MLSIGGDGTFLEAVSFVRNKNIPMLGINSGRLGFLANISSADIEFILDKIFDNEYFIENRALIKLETKDKLFKDFNYGLNDFTIHKNQSSSMITIHAYLNDDYLNSYWADGLIISTPTGSTAYSLSAGGPIVVPNSNNFIITPIAPHSLTVRPMIISDNNILTLKIESRSQNYLASLDYKSEFFNTDVEIKISKADFCIKLVKFKDQSFFETLRNKLMWGLD